MVITSENKRPALRRYSSTQFRYAATYVLITFVVLIFLNYYSSKTTQQLICQNKETSLVGKCRLTSSEISNLDVLSPSTVSSVMSQIGSLRVNRVIVTDQTGLALYDSAQENSALGKTVLLPEIVKALQGNDVFSWQYHAGDMRSRAASPIFTYGTLSGCIYMLELDAEQGALIDSLQGNILWITLVLELVVILFSLAYSSAFSARMRRIMASMRIIREGDYSHKVAMGGHDELTVLGEEFNDLTDRLQASERKRSQFVSDASHELKTPLASIKLLSDSILQNDMDMATIREFVGDIGNEADRLNRMSQKLLSLTRTEAAEESACEIICMAPTVERVVRMLSELAQKHQIKVALDLKDDCPILIFEDDLYQITFNLVENGIKYNTLGGTLSIAIRRDGENAMLLVADTGVGIPEDALEHIFERFYRVDKARSRKSGGSGLGLSIVRSMVERNGGTIHVASTVGKGSVFTVVFPIFDTEEESQ